ncbi:MAG: hypothetical protein ACE5IY_10205 [bacterium]
MKNRTFLLISCIVSMSMFWNACSDWVEEVNPVIDQVSDDDVNTESQANFLRLGVEVRFATAHDQIVLLSEALGDAFFFDFKIPGAINTDLADIESGTILLTNNQVEAMFEDVGELRFLADDLISRVNNRITWTDQEEKRKTLFVANLYAGIARFFFATYIGLTETQGGGVIDAGPFIPANEMYAQALASLQAALDNVPGSYTYGAVTGDSSYWSRVINSIIARIHLYQGETSQAQQFAQNGMQQGDAPFQSLHSSQSQNILFVLAGTGAPQFALPERFNEYVLADPAEKARIPFVDVTGQGQLFHIQTKYSRQDDPIDFMSWQENELMLAELELASNAASALARVNAVRASHGIGDLVPASGTLSEDELRQEIDKELLLTGRRLPDQRRWGIFHLPAGSWQYLPITASERNSNPNLN